MKVVCQACSYRFESDTKKERCPYCGEKGKLVEVKDAEELIGEL